MKSSIHRIQRNALVHPEFGQDSPSPFENPEATRAQIQGLAYQLWTERGRPIGSPEVDWLAAEEQLRKPRIAATAQASAG